MRFPLLAVAVLACGVCARAETAPPIEDLVRRAFDADVTYPYGQEYRRLIERDGRPLDEAERRKEEERFEKAAAKLADESDSARRKRLEKQRKEDEERRKFREEVVRAFDFTIEGEEERGGVPCWRVRAEPRPGYKPSFRQARFLAKMRGRMWIAQDDYGWRRIEVESIDTVSMGLFLFRLREGAEFELEQERVNGEVWMLDDLRIRFDAKLGLVKGLRREVRVAWSDFKRFSAESQIVDAQAAEAR